MSDTYEVSFLESDGSATVLTSQWEKVVAENRPYLLPDSCIIVRDANGKRVYFDRTGSGEK